MMKNEDGFHFATMRWRVTVRKGAIAACLLGMKSERLAPATLIGS